MENNAPHRDTELQRFNAIPAECSLGPVPAGDRGDNTVGHGTLHIAILNDQARHPNDVTHGRHDDTQPTWSPDGKQIAFIRGLQHSSLRILTVASGRIRTVVHNAGSPAWSPDGKSIAFTAIQHHRKAIVRILNVRDGKITTVDPGGPSMDAATWSPDSKRLAVDILGPGFDLPPPKQHTDIGIVRPRGHSIRRLTASHHGIDGPSSWSPNGRRLIIDRETCHSGKRGCDDQLFVIKTSERRPHRGDKVNVVADPGLDPNW